MIHTDFKSEKFRFELVRQIQTNHIKIFQYATFLHKSPSLFFTFELPFHSEIKSKLIYTRVDTKTLVYQLTHKSKLKFILKIYFIKHLNESKNEGIQNYEIEIKYLRLFQDMILSCVCPHFVLAIGHCVVNLSQIISLIPKELQITDGKYMVLLSECAESSVYQLVKTKKISLYCLGGILFQVLIVLVILQDKYPSFRHNDLHCGNVLIQTIEAKKLFVMYTVLHQNYFLNVEECALRCLLWDFFFASMLEKDFRPQVKEICKIKNSKICQNKYFDVHRFLDSLYSCLIDSDCKTPFYTEIKEIIHSFIPIHLRNLSHDEKMELKLFETELFTAQHVIEHSFFNVYRKEPDYKFNIINHYVYPSK